MMASGTWHVEWASEGMRESEEAGMNLLALEALDARKLTHSRGTLSRLCCNSNALRKELSSFLVRHIKRGTVFSWSLDRSSPSEHWRKITGTNDRDVAVGIKVSFVWRRVQWKFLCWCTYTFACPWCYPLVTRLGNPAVRLHLSAATASVSVTSVLTLVKFPEGL